jgi:peptidoglycan/xylan/chitin deacetylase (PgdA/CDA1 family)
VLAYHGIGDARDGFSVTRRDFALQMAMLARAGFDTIGPAQYARFLAGDRRGLPPRPVLVTFDDGRLDSFRGADAVLARHGFRATMFVITGPVDAGHPFYLHWDELRAMRRSGRWDLQEHAADGHRRITVDAAGHEGPFFANRRYAGGRLETLAGFRDRVRADLAQARRALTREIPGYVPAAFAVPYGDFGQNRSNDRRVAPLMRALLGLTYTAVFTQNRAAYTTPATPRTDLQRYELHGGDTADALYDRLRADRPRPERR